MQQMLNWLLPGRLKARRSQPLAHVRAGFGLAGFAECFLALRAGRKGFRLFSEAFGFLGKTFFKGLGLLETTTLRHDITSSYGS